MPGGFTANGRKVAERTPEMVDRSDQVPALGPGESMTEIDWRLIILALGIAGVLIWTFYDAIR